jgi:hypothetical protein
MAFLLIAPRPGNRSATDITHAWGGYEEARRATWTIPVAHVHRWQ